MNEKKLKIKAIRAREIFDCRGYPTIEVNVIYWESNRGFSVWGFIGLDIFDIRSSYSWLH